MRLISIETSGISGLPDKVWRFCDADGRPVSTLVVGRAGKTILLETIAVLKEMVGPYGTVPGQAFRRLFAAPGAKINTVWLLGTGERTQLSFDADWNPSRCEQRVREQFAQRGARSFAFLGSPRIQTSATPDEDVYAVAARGTVELYDAALAHFGALAAADATAVTQKLGQAGFVTALDRPDSLKPLKSRIAERLSEVRLLDVRESAMGTKVDLVHKTGARIGLDDLSRHERDVLLTTAALAALATSQGLLLIDDAFDLVREEDVDAHGSWLQRIAGGCQVLATSRTPHNLTSFPNKLVLEAP